MSRVCLTGETRVARQRNDGFPAAPEDARPIDQMLALALIRLTGRQEGKGEAERWHSRRSYDPSTLDSLSKMELIKLASKNNLITLSERGLIVGEGAALIIAEAFDRMYEEAGPIQRRPPLSTTCRSLARSPTEPRTTVVPFSCASSSTLRDSSPAGEKRPFP